MSIIRCLNRVREFDFPFGVFEGGLDRKVIEELYWKGIPVFYMDSNLMSDDIIWGSPEFSKIGEQKVLLLNKLLPFGYDILMCDTDTVWLKVKIKFVSRFNSSISTCTLIFYALN